MPRVALSVLVLAACGRVDFVPVGDGAAIDAPIDAMPDADTACDPPFSVTSGGCYHVVATPARWADAEALCESENAHLIVIADVAEHYVLHTLLGDAGAARGWLGYSDQVTEGALLWVAPPGVDPTTDSCFLGANPNLATTDCVTQDGPSSCPDWSIQDCATTNPFVCERDNRTIDHASY